MESDEAEERRRRIRGWAECHGLETNSPASA